MAVLIKLVVAGIAVLLVIRCIRWFMRSRTVLWGLLALILLPVLYVGTRGTPTPAPAPLIASAAAVPSAPEPPKPVSVEPAAPLLPIARAAYVPEPTPHPQPVHVPSLPVEAVQTAQHHAGRGGCGSRGGAGYRLPSGRCASRRDASRHPRTYSYTSYRRSHHRRR